MNLSTYEFPGIFARHVEVTDDMLIVQLSDGRVISAPVLWYPRLEHGSPEERAKYEFNGGGYGIHWPDLDEDISVANLLRGQPSGESQKSLQKWLDSRKSAAVSS
ncbi:MAG: DUF2442 domain-containing protein [Pirellulaceae bacterium]|nr:DUF2442 domain-containing protein [Pirellulaceae bacterium]